MQTVVDLGRSAREKRGISLKTPVKGITVICKDRGTLNALEKLQSYVKGELNAWEVGQEMGEKIEREEGVVENTKGSWVGRRVACFFSGLEHMFLLLVLLFFVPW